MVLTSAGLVNPVKIKHINCVALPKHERLKHRPNLLTTPVFAEDVSRIDVAINVKEGDNLGSDGFTNSVKGQGSVALVKLGVRQG